LEGDERQRWEWVGGGFGVRESLGVCDGEDEIGRERRKEMNKKKKKEKVKINILIIYFFFFFKEKKVTLFHIHKKNG
jgi:hypothetical protein